jgi:hypothetical protein
VRSPTQNIKSPPSSNKVNIIKNSAGFIEILPPPSWLASLCDLPLDGIVVA